MPPPRAWDEFEDIVCSAAKNRWDNPTFTRHGRQGQKQDGVDVYGKDLYEELVGLQCKNTISELNEKLIRAEVEKAKKFDGQLTALFIATTLEPDRKLQRLVRNISREETENGGFEVHILFWHDIWHDLTLDDRRVLQHYPNLKAAGAMPGQGSSTCEQAPGATIHDAGRAPPRQHDVEIFEKLQRSLPFGPTLHLLQEHDFGAAFRRDAIQPLFDFVDTWNSPEYEFIDGTLQAKLTDLYQAAAKMSDEIATLTVPIGREMEMASVYSDHLRDQGGPRPAWVIRDGQILNASARLFVPIYNDFIRFARNKLNP